MMSERPVLETQVRVRFQHAGATPKHRLAAPARRPEDATDDLRPGRSCELLERTRTGDLLYH